MAAKGFLCLLAAALLGLSAYGDDAGAARCRPGKPCDGLTRAPAVYYLEAQSASDILRKKRRARRLREASPPEEFTGEENVYDNGLAGGDLIPQSLAVTQALAAYPDAKPLGVKLLPGPSPVYAVKLRVDGQVLRVRIDAQSGQILGE